MASADILTSDVVNYLVMRYLQESGFSHTAFVFGHESTVSKSPVDPNNVPPGSLITFIQKGMQYLEMEANLQVICHLPVYAVHRYGLDIDIYITSQDGSVEGEFKLLSPEDLLTNNIDQLRQIVAERKDDDRTAKPEREKKREKSGKGGRGSESVPNRMDLEDRLDVSPSSVSILDGHESEVYCCQWSPTEPILASG